MSTTKITQYIHRPNITELGMGNTHETYMLISSQIDLSGVFPNATVVEVEDFSTGKIYKLKSAIGNEFRVNQLGEIYRDYNILPGDEIIITKVEKGNSARVFLAVKKYNRVVLTVNSNGAEITNMDRLELLSIGDRKYSLDVFDRGSYNKLEISFKAKKKKRSDSPVETDYYNASLNGASLANGTYYLTISDKSTLVSLVKSDFNVIEYNDDMLYVPEDISNNDLSIDKSLQQIYYGAPGTGKSHIINDVTKGESVIRTTFHPDSDYSTFVGAYKPTTKEVILRDLSGHPVIEGDVTLSENKIVYEFVGQSFLKAYIQAWKFYAEEDGEKEPKKQFLVIEEINRGNCAQIFGDLFQLLDRNNAGFSDYPINADNDMKKQLAKAFKGLSIASAESINAQYNSKDMVSKVLSGEILLLPNNLYIWATMNTSDQSLFPIDSAFKRRWEWKYMKIKEGKDENGNSLDWKIVVKGADGNNRQINGEDSLSWWTFIQKINDIIASMTSSADKQLGYFFCKAKDGVISGDKFVSKVVFYLWNDVFKDYGFEDASLFRYETVVDGKSTEKDLTFPDFYDEEGENINVDRLVDFLEKVLAWQKPEDNA